LKTKRRWRDIADDNVRHRWDRNCACVGVAEIMYVAPDNFVNGGIPACEECGRERNYVKTQIIRGKR